MTPESGQCVCATLYVCVRVFVFVYVYVSGVADVENYGSGTTKWTRDKAEVQNL